MSIHNDLKRDDTVQAIRRIDCPTRERKGGFACVNADGDPQKGKVHSERMNEWKRVKAKLNEDWA